MKKAASTFIVLFIATTFSSFSQTPPPEDPDIGLRAEWMKGALGMLWLPENTYNGNIEGQRMDDFLAQIDHLKTVDFIQIGLSSTFIFSPSHSAPHPILESLWEGDTDNNGDPINLIVPRASVDDPFLAWLESIRAAGLRTEVYVNSNNMLQWLGFDSPEPISEASKRWIEYCDTNPEVQAFINSRSYHTDGTHDDRRPYMFAYAEFILKEYAIRYGDLIDAWCFDAAHVNIEGASGDDSSTDKLDDQRVYQAFADAVHAGNPNAAVAFNNGVGDRDSNPFLPYQPPSLFEDYKFGHPFGGAGNMVEPREPLYRVNFGICQYMRDTNGLPYQNYGIARNDNVVAHFFPKQSTTSWNDGFAPCLTDAEFVEWNNVGLINGGGITWGTPLVRTNLLNKSPDLTLQPYALRQFEAVEADLRVNQFPGAPNWARQYTILPDAEVGKAYSHTLVEGVDFWDPEGDEITNVFPIDGPSWLTIEETSPGTWTLSGTPDEAYDMEYDFRIRANDATKGRNRSVTLSVIGGDFIPVQSIEVSPKNVTLEITNTQQLNGNVTPSNASNKNYTWETSDENIATVDENGIITAIAEGIATITVTTQDGQKTDTSIITVLSSEDPFIEVTGILISPKEFSLEIENTLQLTAQISPVDANNQGYTWTSSDTTIATVDNNGLVTAIAEGTTSITVTTEEGGFADTSIITTYITAEEFDDVIMYPNPTESEITINNAENSIIQIHDILGKILLTIPVKNNSETIDLNNLSQGTYYLQIFSLNAIKTLKIIKQ